MNRKHLVTVIVCFFSLVLFGAAGARKKGPESGSLTVGFLYENDESTPNTYNFAMACNALQKTFGDKVKIKTRSNVRESDVSETLRELARSGCDVIFTNTHAAVVPETAKAFPSATGTRTFPKNPCA